MAHVDKTLDAYGTAILADNDYQIKLSRVCHFIETATNEELDELLIRAEKQGKSTLAQMVKQQMEDRIV